MIKFIQTIKNNIMKNSKLLIGAVLALTIVTILKGFVLMKLWGWFVVTLFHDVPPLGLVQAIGLALVVGHLTYTDISALVKEVPEPNLKKIAQEVLKSIFKLMGTLGIGWVILQFM